MLNVKSSFIFILIAIVLREYETARILAVFPTASHSHYITGSALVRGLAEKNHDVTVITPFNEKKHPNIRLIQVPEAAQNIYVKALLNNDKMMGKALPIDFITTMHASGTESCRLLFESSKVQKLLTSPEEHFDLIIIEIFLSESLLGLVDHFKAPVIAFSSFGSNSWQTELVGATQQPAFVPHLLIPLSPFMNYWERVANTAVHACYLIYFHYIYMPQQEVVHQKYFPNAERSLIELRKNVSLVILNQHFSLSSPRQYPPNIIEAGGMHIDDKVQPLPADLQTILDKASDGAIYFSLGTNFKSKDIPADKLKAILNTFASLKQTILWKFESDNSPNLPSNVVIRPWFPQASILRHPNIKLFITHGGLLSTTETIYYGIPIVGVPLFGDQPLNMKIAERRGIGRRVDYATLNENNFKEAVNDVIYNSKYTQTVQKMSRIYRDQPLKPIDTAVFWTEYVLRHNGALHFHSPAVDLNFWQYHSLDTISMIITILTVVIGGFIWLLIVLLRFLIHGKKKVKTH